MSKKYVSNRIAGDDKNPSYESHGVCAVMQKYYLPDTDEDQGRRKKKVIFFSPPPPELSGRIFGGNFLWEFFRASKKVYFFLVARPLSPLS